MGRCAARAARTTARTSPAQAGAGVDSAFDRDGAAVLRYLRHMQSRVAVGLFVLVGCGGPAVEPAAPSPSPPAPLPSPAPVASAPPAVADAGTPPPSDAIPTLTGTPVA